MSAEHFGSQRFHVIVDYTVDAVRTVVGGCGWLKLGFRLSNMVNGCCSDRSIEHH